MIRGFTCNITLMLLTGCTSAGLINDPPIVRYPVNPVNVTINRVIPRDYFFDNLVFMINDVEVNGVFTFDEEYKIKTFECPRWKGTEDEEMSTYANYFLEYRKMQQF